MRKMFVFALAFTVLFAAVPAASAGDYDFDNVVDAVLATSGTEGFDNDKKDYDLLREAVLATGLAGALADAEGITVFAPNDKAFYRLAKDLGYDGKYDEAAILGFLVGGLDAYSGDAIGTLTAVLLYHVSPEAMTAKEIKKADSIDTLLGASFDSKGYKLMDAETDLKDPKVKRPRDIMTGNGYIQGIDRVLIPVSDLVG